MKRKPKKLKFVAEPAFFDASCWAIDAFKARVEARPWRRDHAIDLHLLRELADLGVLYFEYLCRSHEQQGDEDEVDMGDPRFAAWLSRLTRNFQRWHVAVKPLSEEIDALFGAGIREYPSTNTLVLSMKATAVGRALAIAGSKYCVELGDLSNQFQSHEVRPWATPEYDRAVAEVAARVRGTAEDEPNPRP